MGQGNPAQAFGNEPLFARLRSLLLPWIRDARPQGAGTAGFAADLQVVSLKVGQVSVCHDVNLSGPYSPDLRRSRMKFLVDLQSLGVEGIVTEVFPPGAVILPCFPPRRNIHPKRISLFTRLFISLHRLYFTMQSSPYDPPDSVWQIWQDRTQFH